MATSASSGSGRTDQIWLSEVAAPEVRKTVTIEGRHYAVHGDEGKIHLLHQLLHSPSVSAEQLDSALVKLGMEDFTTSKAKAVGSHILIQALPSAQVALEERIRRVENGLIPEFPIPGKGAGPFKIVDRMKDLGVSEVRVAVLNGGAVEWARDWTLGLGKEEERPRMMSQAASISKNATALTVLSLISYCRTHSPSGLIDNMTLTLDTEVGALFEKDPRGRELWKKINPEGYPITVKQLLSHTAGLVNAFTDEEREIYEIDWIDRDFLDKVRVIHQKLAPSFGPEETSALEAAIKELEELQKRYEWTPSSDLNTLISRKQQEISSFIKNHSSSWPKGSSDFLIEELKNLDLLQKRREEGVRGPISTDDFLEGKFFPVRVVGPPGGEFAEEKYSNAGYVVLQKTLEIATQKPFAEIVQERVFNPLKMKSTYNPSPEKVIRGVENDGKPLLGWGCVVPPASGGLWTYPSDCAQLALALQRASAGGSITDADGAVLIDGDLAAQMLQDSPKPHTYTLGTEIDKAQNGSAYFFHGGALSSGCKTIMMAQRALGGPGVVVFTNCYAGGKILLDEIIRGVSKEYDWSGRETLSFAHTMKTEPLDPREWFSSVQGTYTFETQDERHAVTVVSEEGKVVAKVDQDKHPPGPTLTLTPLNKTTACFPREDLPGQFTLCDFKEEEGKMCLFLWGAKHIRQ
jgi:CubicO group peptidase (beta-lactamase class C family)